MTNNPPAGGADVTATTAPRPAPAPDVRILKVSQIDAGRLDGELTSLLRGPSQKEQFMRIFSRLHPGAIAHRQYELTFVLDLLVFYFTVWSCRPTPGMDLMNLRYRDERRTKSLGRGAFKTGMEGPNLSVTQRLLYGVLFVGGRYVWSKVTRHANTSQWADEDERTWRYNAWRSIGFVENAHSAASLMNLMLFLRNGRYRSLMERLLRARLVYKEPNMSRVISFEYLNRQLVWQELSLALFLLPLINAPRIQALASRMFSSLSSRRREPPTRAASSSSLSSSDAADGGDGNGDGAPRLRRDCSSCAACQSLPATTPYSAQPCGHVYCYYCIRARCKLDAQFKCLACNQRVFGIRQSS